VTATAYADDKAAYDNAVEQIAVPFERLEKALEKQGGGPFFNGATYSLVDAAYAPFLQRYVFLDRIRKLGHIEKFPRLKAWCEALLSRASTHSFRPASSRRCTARICGAAISGCRNLSSLAGPLRNSPPILRATAARSSRRMRRGWLVILSLDAVALVPVPA
jgi:hypothetical protein